MAKAIVVAAPSSGSGKTLATLGLVRALNDAGVRTASAKVGPDYIDPRFHEIASRRHCPNLDIWAMGAKRCEALLAAQAEIADLVVVEGVMGLFDGPEGAAGSTADLTAALSLPIILVIDAAHQSQSIAAVVHGFSTFRSDVQIAGIILNRVASQRHETLLRQALSSQSIPVLGCIHRQTEMQWPSRHLGLVQAMENPSTEQFVAKAATIMAQAVDITSIATLASRVTAGTAPKLLEPLGQRMAVARDAAFSFAYPHLLNGWRNQGCELKFFSPLADEPVPEAIDAIFLPGGYPELHAEKLSNSIKFLPSLRNTDALVYGECGGFMVLGKSLIDAQGFKHPMASLLPHSTSFQHRKLHLGYRRLIPLSGPWQATLRGHEFHYSTLEEPGDAEPLFRVEDASGRDLGMLGARRGKVMGSYAHVIAEEQG